MPLSLISTIGQLVSELLRIGNADDYGVVLARYAIPGRDLESYFRWNARHYTRTCVQRNAAFELLVICYEPGQSTSIHDFDSQTAWVHPLVGMIIEERFDLDRHGVLFRTEEVEISKGELGQFSSEKGIHRFANRGPCRAVTLNLYAKPISQWRVYDERTGSSDLSPAGPPR